MRKVLTILLFSAMFQSAVASEPKIVVSINPVHSLVASVTEGITAPELLIKGTDSLHGYQIKPSDVNLLESANVVIWVGPNLESTFRDSISNLRENVTVIEVGELHGIKLYETRESTHSDHESNHEMHQTEEHDEHEHDRHDEHTEHAHEEQTEHTHEKHEHGLYDLHLWLDIDNAKTIAKETTETIARLFPQHKALLTSNLKNTINRLNALEHQLRHLSESIEDKPYVVFHDAYQYFERMFHLNNVGTVTLNPEREIGAKRLVELRETIENTRVKCIFKEPQFNPSALEIVAEGTNLKIGTLDPLGADIQPGPEAYSVILRNLMDSLRDCLI